MRSSKRDDEYDGDEPFEYEQKVICVHTVPDAIKVTPVQPHKPVPFWVPQSAVHDNSEVWKKGDEGKLVVQMWLARERKWV